MTIDAFHGFTLAIVLLFVGKGLVARWGILRRYSIPESLVGGRAEAAGRGGAAAEAGRPGG